jgi:hypothetical protein
VCGDVEKTGWEFIFKRMSVLENLLWRWFLRNTDILISAHHGHASGFSTDLLNVAKPKIVLASVSSKNPNVDERYSDDEFVSSYKIGGEVKRLLTTRKYGHIRISISESINCILGDDAIFPWFGIGVSCGYKFSSLLIEPATRNRQLAIHNVSSRSASVRYKSDLIVCYMEDDHQIRAYCNSCGRETRHSPVYIHPVTIQEKDSNFIRPKTETWELLRCCGCDDIRVRRISKYIDSGQAQIRYYPPVEIRKLPKWSAELPDAVRELQSEIYSTMHTKNFRLAAMGARALLEMTMTAAVGDIGTFNDKLKTMVQKRYLAERDIETLKVAFDAGSAVSHRGHKPNSDDFDKLMDIVEHLLEQFFYIQRLGEKLKQSVPPRIVEVKRG